MILHAGPALVAALTSSLLGSAVEILSLIHILHAGWRNGCGTIRALAEKIREKLGRQEPTLEHAQRLWDRAFRAAEQHASRENTSVPLPGPETSARYSIREEIDSSHSGEYTEENAGMGDSESEKTITNSAGREVKRKYVKNQDELLKKAEEAAGGNLDDFEEIKPGWYKNQEGTIKIEWNPEGHANTNEGPHVTVRHKNNKGGWSVVEKYFIEGRDSY